MKDATIVRQKGGMPSDNGNMVAVALLCRRHIAYCHEKSPNILIWRGATPWIGEDARFKIEHASASKRAFIRADFWEGDATKHFSVKKGVFSEKEGGNSVNVW